MQASRATTQIQKYAENCVAPLGKQKTVRQPQSQNNVTSGQTKIMVLSEFNRIVLQALS